MKGEDVRAVQNGLNTLNHGTWDALDPDGDFGQHTEDAVKAFQGEKGLDPDGAVGKYTRQALFPLVAVSLNVIGFRTSNPSALSPPQQRINDAFSPGRLTPLIVR